MAAAEKKAAAMLEKLASAGIPDDDTSLFDTTFSYKNENQKSKEEADAEYRRFIERVNQKRQTAACLL